MRPTVLAFGAEVLADVELKGSNVLEIGSADINGSLRSIVESQGVESYIGIDLYKQRGVDLVTDPAELHLYHSPASFDGVICTEVLEHAENWRSVVHCAKTFLKPGGWLLVTTRSPGYPRHNHPNDYWRFTKKDFAAIFSDMQVLRLEDDPSSLGVFLFARKGDDFAACDLTNVEPEQVDDTIASVLVEIMYDRPTWERLQYEDNIRPRDTAFVEGWKARIESEVSSMLTAIDGYIYEDDTFADFGGGSGWGAQCAVDKLRCKGLVLDIEPSSDTLENIKCELESIPLPDASISWGICHHVVEHAYDLKRVLSEIFRVTRCGVLFTIPLEDEELALKTPAHVRFSNSATVWVEKLRVAGFIVAQTWNNRSFEISLLALKPDTFYAWSEGVTDMQALETAKRFDVVIAYYRQKDKLATIIEGLLHNLLCINKIIVVNDEPWQEIPDDFSIVGVDTIFLDHPHEGKGPSQSFNQGVAAATTDYVLLMEGDIVLPNGALLQDSPRVKPNSILVRGVTRVDPVTHQTLHADWRVQRAQQLKRIGRSYMLMACNYTIVDRAAYLALGGFNVDLCKLHGSNSYADEDRDLALRWQAKYGIDSIDISSEKPVIHLGGRRQNGVDYTPVEAREILVESMALLYGRRYHLFCGTAFRQDYINVNHLEISDGMDVRLDCIGLKWLKDRSATSIVVQPPLYYFTVTELQEYLQRLATKLTPGGSCQVSIDTHPYITAEVAVEKVPSTAVTVTISDSTVTMVAK